MRSIALFIAITIATSLSSFAKNYVVTALSPYKITSTLNINAGDTIFLDRSRFREICFDHLSGLEGRPIVITNIQGLCHFQEGPVNIRISHSHYLKITGTGSHDFEYGIKLSNSKVMGLSIEQFSDNIEVDHLEITGSGFTGIAAKTDNYLDNAQNDDEKTFVLKNIHFHHNYIHHLKDGEGFYVGHNAWPANAEGKAQHAIAGVNIHDNIMEFTPREAVQVGACISGDNRIHHNIIHNFGKIYIDSNQINDQPDPDQSNGIQLGQGFLGDCYNNWIEYGTGKAIQLVGIHGANVYNNIIIKPNQWAFYVGNGRGQIKNVKPVNILYNTIISPGKQAIKFDPRNDSIICNFYNNLIYDAKGIKDPAAKSGIFTSDNELKQYNILENDSSKIKFISLKNYNFKLQQGSIAIQKAYNTENMPIHFSPFFDYSCKGEDLDKNKKNRNDIGAFEFILFK